MTGSYQRSSTRPAELSRPSGLGTRRSDREGSHRIPRSRHHHRGYCRRTRGSRRLPLESGHPTHECRHRTYGSRLRTREDRRRTRGSRRRDLGSGRHSCGSRRRTREAGRLTHGRRLHTHEASLRNRGSRHRTCGSRHPNRRSDRRTLGSRRRSRGRSGFLVLGGVSFSTPGLIAWVGDRHDLPALMVNEAPGPSLHGGVVVGVSRIGRSLGTP